MSIKRKVLPALGALALAAGITAAAGTGAAHATTLTCTDTQGVTTVAGAAYGCGGLSFTAESGAFSLADTVNDAGDSYDSAPITIEPTSETSPRLDFTVFNLCDPDINPVINPSVTVGGSANIHGCTAQTVTPFPSGSAPLPETLSGAGLGVYVAMITPDGEVPDYTVTGGNNATTPAFTGDPDYSGTCDQADGSTYTNTIPCPGETFEPGPGTYCISVAEFVGPNGKDRWWALDRQCDTNGEFTYGTAVTPGTVNWDVANRWQAWEPQIGSAGLLMTNISLYNKYDSEYDLNVTGNRFVSGEQLQAYPDNQGGVVNDQTDYTACTPPGTLLSVFGRYGLC